MKSRKPNERKLVIKDPSRFGEVTATIRQAAKQAQLVSQQVAAAAKQSKAAGNNSKGKGKDKKKNGAANSAAAAAQKSAEAAEKAAAAAAKNAAGLAAHTPFYEHVLPQMLDKDIPVTISYSLNGEHRIILAYSGNSKEAKKK